MAAIIAGTTLGAGAAAATGDLSKFPQYMVAGGVAANAGADALANKVEDFADKHKRYRK